MPTFQTSDLSPEDREKLDLITVTAPIDLDNLDMSAVNLEYLASSADGTVRAEGDGTDATIPLADGTDAGLMSPADKNKLDAIQALATANATDSQLRDRSTHTGTQLAATISDFAATASAAAPVQTVAGKSGTVTLDKTDVGLDNVDNTADADKPVSTATQTALDLKQNALGYTAENTANKGIANGYASLGVDGKVPSAQLPADGSYQGTWNADTNSPTIVSSTGTNGDFYFVSTAGTTTIDSISSWSVGDQIRFNGSVWEKIPSSSAVASVAGKTGVVTLDASDVGLGNVTNVAQAPATRTITAGTGLTGGGDLSANRTLAVSFGTSAGTACEGNDSRLSDARTPTSHTHTASDVTDFSTAAAAAAPVASVAGKTGTVTLSVGDVSGAAPLASPTFTGTPAAPTPATSDNTTKVATTAYVKNQGYVTSSGVTAINVTAPITSTGGATPTIAISAATSSAAGSMSANDKLKIDSVAFGAQVNAVQSVAGRTGVITLAVADVSGAAPLASPALTGTPTAPTASTADSSTQIATTAFVKAQNYLTSAVTSVSGTAPIVSSGGSTPAISISAATTGAAGSMSAADKTKLDRLTVTQEMSLDRMLLRVLDVTHYGADPTGVDDSTAAIQAAMDAAQPVAPTISTGTGSSINRRYGGVVYFPKGTYRITSSLIEDGSGHGICWMGDGAVLVNDGISSDRWMIEFGQHGHETNAPMFIYMRGLVFHKIDRGIRIGGVDNNINLGKAYFENCDFIGNIDDDGFAVRIYNRSSSVEFKNCQWDNCLISLEVQSCDLVYLNDCRMQIRHFAKLSETRRQDVHGYFIVRHGQLHVKNFIANTPNPNAWAPGGTYAVGDIRKVECTDDSPDLGIRWYSCTSAHTAGGGQAFDEAYIASYWELCESPSNPLGWFKSEDYHDWATSTDYVIGDIVYNGGTAYWCNEAHTSGALWSDNSSKFTAVDTNSISVWTDITIDDSLFGGEGGGIPPVLWNIEPDTATSSIQYQKALVIRNCQIGNDLQGYGDEGYATACLFCHRPNTFVFTDNRFSYTYCLPADYWVDGSLPTWPPTSSVSASQFTPCDVTVHGNNGSAFRGVTELATVHWPYSPNWVPYDIRVPTLFVNDAGPQLPGDHRAFKTANTSSTSISRFLGAEPGKVFTVYITDANTTILNGDYIKLAGGATFTPGAAGGCITFLVIDDPTYQSRCMELSRVTYA